MQEDGTGGSVVVRSLEGGLIPLGKGYVFERYDGAMNKTKEFIYENKNSIVLGTVVNAGAVTVVDFTYDKKRKAVVCYGATAGINDFNFTK